MTARVAPTTCSVLACTRKAEPDSPYCDACLTAVIWRWLGAAR
jgi:hypothetical protein